MYRAGRSVLHISRMTKRVRRSLSAVAALLLTACGPGGEPHVGIFVETRLSAPLSDAIEQLRGDLAAEGVTLLVVDSLTADVSPQILRDVLRSRSSTVSLQGAILVGNFGAPLFNVPNQQGDPYWHDHLSDLYYMDLDGDWVDADGDGVFDTHRDHPPGRFGWPWLGGGDREPELWVSRLRTGPLTGVGEEVALLTSYFARNHEYRTGQDPDVDPRIFLVGAGIDLPHSDWGAQPEDLYEPDRIDAVLCTDTSSVALRTFLSSGERYELGVVNSFSGPRIHHFDVHEGEGYDPFWDRWPEGRRAVTAFSDVVHPPYDVSWRDIVEWQPRVRFYQLLSSETGRHDQENYLAGAYVFSGEGLAAIAGTQHSGAMGTPGLYADLAAGRTLGDAWRRALAYELERTGEPARLAWCDEGMRDEPYGVWPHKAVLIGDGSLRLRGGATAGAG
jgi:hypothetical protein